MPGVTPSMTSGLPALPIAKMYHFFEQDRYQASSKCHARSDERAREREGGKKSESERTRERIRVRERVNKRARDPNPDP